MIFRRRPKIRTPYGPQPTTDQIMEWARTHPIKVETNGNRTLGISAWYDSKGRGVVAVGRTPIYALGNLYEKILLEDAAKIELAEYEAEQKRLAEQDTAIV